MCLMSLLLLTSCVGRNLEYLLLGFLFRMEYNGPAIQTNVFGLNNFAQIAKRILITSITGTPAQDTSQIVTFVLWETKCLFAGFQFFFRFNEEKYLPVPNGRIAQGGLEHSESWPTLSKHCRTQPTVPSPPHTKIL